MNVLPRLRATASRCPERIRIAFVIDSLSRAGTETQLLALIQLLDRSRFEPSLVLLDGRDTESQRLEPTDCPVLRLHTTKLFSRRGFAAARELRRAWRKRRPDIVQAYFLDSAYFAVPLAKLCGVKTVLRVRNNLGYWMTRKHRIFNRMIKPLVNSTLTNSESGREQLLEQDRLTADRVMVLENGVDLPALTARISGPAIVGCVANLRPVKNLDGLLRAAAIVHRQRPEVRFAIAGEGPERAALEALRDQLGLREAVVFHGSVADVPAFLQTLTLAVLPSHSEGMSNALLEAMAAGQAVVATDVGANARVLGDTGTIVPPRDDEALAAAILELIQKPEQCASLGRAARQRVEANYSRRNMVRRFEEFYGELNQQGSRRLQPA